MSRKIKLGALSVVALLTTTAIAMAGIKSGEYSGSTIDDSEPITIKVGKKPGERGKWVKNVFVEQSAECSADLEFTKDDKIKNGKFKVVIKSSLPGLNEASVKGEFVTEGVIAGTLEQITCDGNEDDYTAYLEN